MTVSMKMLTITLFLPMVSAELFSSVPVNSEQSTALVLRGKRQCGGMGGCCSGSCNCGSNGACGQVCCPSAPPPCTCDVPGCLQCTTKTVYVPVQQTTCCKCCQPVCTSACMNGGGCSCGCTRGGCNRKRRSLLLIAEEEKSKKQPEKAPEHRHDDEMSKKGDNFI